MPSGRTEETEGQMDAKASMLILHSSSQISSGLPLNPCNSSEHPAEITASNFILKGTRRKGSGCHGHHGRPQKLEVGPLLSVASLLAARSWAKGTRSEFICWPSHPLSKHLLSTTAVGHILKQGNEVRTPALKKSPSERAHQEHSTPANPPQRGQDNESH